jgi:hypothetical protein
MTPDVALDILNTIAFITLIGLLGAGLFGLARHIRLYWAAQMSVPILLKRDVALLSALAVIGLETMTLRVLGVGQLEGWVRVAYVAQADIILLWAIIYWVKIELFDVDSPSVI